MLRGSLAPDGAIFKRAAATPALFEIEGRAVVFENLEDLAARIDDPALDVTPNDVLVLKNAGPHGAAMPEAGYLPIPAKLARAGVKDMVRISDARMSGTAYGTIVLHAAPEAAVGGPLAAVRNGDRIALSVANKRLDLLRRRGRGRSAASPTWQPPPMPERGYAALYRRSVLQAPAGLRLRFPGGRGKRIIRFYASPDDGEILSLAGRPALSPFRLAKLLHRPLPSAFRPSRRAHRRDVPALRRDRAAARPRTSARRSSAPDLRPETARRRRTHGGTRSSSCRGPGTISPWSSKATDIARNCGLDAVVAHRARRAVSRRDARRRAARRRAIARRCCRSFTTA